MTTDMFADMMNDVNVQTEVVAKSDSIVDDGILVQAVNNTTTTTAAEQQSTSASIAMPMGAMMDDTNNYGVQSYDTVNSQVQPMSNSNDILIENTTNIDNNDNINDTNDNINNNDSQPIALGYDTNPYEQPPRQASTSAPARGDTPSGDIFAGLGGDETSATARDENGNSNADELKENTEKTDDEPTFLSVWLEQRMKELGQRRIDENETKDRLLTEAQETLEQFHMDRAAKIEARQKDNRMKEESLREDLMSTFQHGTIWEQVGKMVNLQEQTDESQQSNRMRSLLIHLKNTQLQQQ
jgi:hypothetical protein